MKIVFTFLFPALLSVPIVAQVAPPVTSDVVPPPSFPDESRPTCKLPDDEDVSINPVDTLAPQKEDTNVYAYVEEFPAFPGGDSAWRAFVANTMRYPDPTMCSVGCVTGTAYVRFIIEKDGSVTHVEVVKHPNSEYIKNEAERIVKSSPPWIPGKQGGNAVRCSVVQPIRFTLQ